VPENVRAGFIYLVMASFGTLCLLLGFGLLAGPDGHYAFAQLRAAHPPAAIGALALVLALLGAGSRPASCRCTSGFRSRIRSTDAGGVLSGDEGVANLTSDRSIPMTDEAMSPLRRSKA